MGASRSPRPCCRHMACVVLCTRHPERFDVPQRWPAPLIGSSRWSDPIIVVPRVRSATITRSHSITIVCPLRVHEQRLPILCLYPFHLPNMVWRTLPLRVFASVVLVVAPNLCPNQLSPPTHGSNLAAPNTMPDSASQSAFAFSMFASESWSTREKERERERERETGKREQRCCAGAHIGRKAQKTCIDHCKTPPPSRV